MNIFVRALCLLLAAGALLATAPSGFAAANAGRDSDLAAYIDDVVRVQMKKHDLPVAVISVVRDGQVIFARGYGHADQGQARAVDPEKSMFRIGSVAKLFTWTAVMQLVEQGKLDLDRDVNVYLRGLRIPEAFGRPVTLRALMTHTAGFEDGAIGYLSHIDPKTDASIQRTLAAHIPERVRAPSTLPAYSNFGAALAGLIVEQVSGVPFNDYVRNNILTPLGMRYSTFEEPLPTSLARHAVVAHDADGPVPFEIIAGFRPAGSMSASALDMARFMIAHLQRGRFGDRQMLRPETADLMHRGAFWTDRRLPGMALGFYEGQINESRTIGHAGATTHFLSNMTLVPEAQLGIFVSYIGSSSAAHRAITRAIVSRGRHQPPPAPTINVPDSLTSYIGNYQPSRRSFTKIDKIVSLGSQITVSAHGDSGLAVSGFGDADEYYVSRGKGVFRQVGGPRVIAFSRLVDGRAQILSIDTAPYSPAERVAWHESTTLWWLILLAGTVTLLVAPLLFLRRPQGATSAVETWGVRSAAMVVGCGLAAVLGIGLAIVSNAETLEHPVALSLRLSLLLPILLLLAMAPLAWFTLAAWRTGMPCLRRRIALTIILGAGIALCLFFNEWNLFGWRFG